MTPNNIHNAQSLWYALGKQDGEEDRAPLFRAIPGEIVATQREFMRYTKYGADYIAGWEAGQAAYW